MFNVMHQFNKNTLFTKTKEIKLFLVLRVRVRVRERARERHRQRAAHNVSYQIPVWQQRNPSSASG